MALEDLVEGWTGRISETLLSNGSAIDLTGCTVALQLRGVDQKLVTIAGSTGIASPASAGIVYFDPGAGDLVAALSPYGIRWKVTDATTKVTFFPNSFSAEWTVRKA